MFWFSTAFAGSFVLENVRIVDAAGVRTAAEIAVVDGRIAGIGDVSAAWADLPRFDAGGRTVVPGLVDAHVHLTLTPGGAFRDPTPADEDAARAHHLRAYVACGVTAVLDTGLAIEDAARLRALDGPAPEIRLLGPLVSPPGGYVHVVIPRFPATPDAATLAAQLAAFDVYDPIGVKVTMEDGLVRNSWPLHSEEVLAALAAQPRPLFVHAMEASEYARALDTLPVHAFVHPPMKADAALVARLRGIPVVTTLSVYDAMLTPMQPGRLEAPGVKRVVPPAELRAAGDPDAVHQSNVAVAEAILPGLPGFLRGLVVRQMTREAPIQKRVERVGRAVRALHAGGVELVVGSDSGNWPLFLNYFHGPTTLRELEVLQEVGFTPAEVLEMATVNGARLLGLDGEIGTIEVGKRASFLVTNGDPLVDIGALRDLRWVAHDGRLLTPDEWMAAPPDPPSASAPFSCSAVVPAAGPPASLRDVDWCNNDYQQGWGPMVNGVHEFRLDGSDGGDHSFTLARLLDVSYSGDDALAVITSTTWMPTGGSYGDSTMVWFSWHDGAPVEVARGTGMAFERVRVVGGELEGHWPIPGGAGSARWTRTGDRIEIVPGSEVYTPPLVGPRAPAGR